MNENSFSKLYRGINEQVYFNVFNNICKYVKKDFIFLDHCPRKTTLKKLI